MDLNAEKRALIKVLEQINDESLIQAIQHMVNYAIKRDEEYLGISTERYNQELEDAEKRIKEGNFVAQEEAIRRIKGWRSKEK